MTPTIFNYMDNNQSNSMAIVLNNLTIYFSYKTPIAFHTPKTGHVVRENDWGPTTGKHLNKIDDRKEHRISGKDFEAQLNKLTAKL